ncbi:hypothetical protein BK796_16705 [Kosakonia pseudosacchari]|uniref:Uncharacterized protein n=1 Tax=Kosakonia pseudosacchari TaxID=1646340 RepID=A0ABX4IP37_9ENTR|nr:hypothetical protein BK796_16705 [Kosakonia pseudosacchari]
MTSRRPRKIAVSAKELQVIVMLSTPKIMITVIICNKFVLPSDFQPHEFYALFIIRARRQ